MQAPLAKGPETLAEYTSWHAEHLPDESHELPQHVRKGYEKAQEMVKLRHACEAAVTDEKPVDTDLLAAYMAYIKLEEVINLQCHQDISNMDEFVTSDSLLHVSCSE